MTPVNYIFFGDIWFNCFSKYKYLLTCTISFFENLHVMYFLFYFYHVTVFFSTLSLISYSYCLMHKIFKKMNKWNKRNLHRRRSEKSKRRFRCLYQWSANIAYINDSSWHLSKQVISINFTHLPKYTRRNLIRSDHDDIH